MTKALLLILSITLIYTISCNNKIVGRICKPISKENKEFTLIGFSTTIPNINGKAFLWDSSKNSQIIDSVFIQKNQFETYFSNLCNDSNSRKFLSILYINKFVTKNDRIDTSNIVAIGNYYYYKTHYIFKLFMKKNGRYEENKELTTKTYRITNNSIEDIGENIIFKNSLNYTLIEIDKEPSANFYNIKGEELLFEKIQGYKKLH